MSEDKLDRILEALGRLERRVDGMAADVGTLRSDVGTLRSDVGTLKQRQEEVLVAFREQWSHWSSLHRAQSEELLGFEKSLGGRLAEVTQSIQALKTSIENQDYRADALAKRVTRLEMPDEPPL